MIALRYCCKRWLCAVNRIIERIQMNSKKYSKNGAILAIASTLILLPNCGFIDWIKEKFGGGKKEDMGTMQMAPAAARLDDGSPVLVTIDGKPLITKNMLESEKKKLIESNPQMEAMISLMNEDQLNRNLADGMASREVIRKYIQDRDIQNQEKYKKDFETAMNQIRDLLNTRYFMEDFSTQVSDAEVKKFYDENKDTIPNLLLSRGGIESVGVPFNNEQQARDFMAKVRTAKNDLTAAARDAGLSDKMKDFQLVNDQSVGIEPELRDKVSEIKTIPSVHNFKVGKEYWIVAALKKEEPKYRDLDSVKNEIKQLLEKDKTMKRVEEEVARLRNEYRIQFNDEFFSKSLDNTQAFQAAADEGESSMQTADAAPSAERATVV